VREIRRYIERRTDEQQGSPFIVWLSDDTVPPRDRLTRWLPCAAPWVFGFKDLNGVLLTYPDEEAARDPYKRAINAHVHEDSTHWMLYLEDLLRLELDAESRFPDVLRFLWGNETRSQRLAVYKLSVLAARAEAPLLRYCLIAALESFAHLLFATLQRVATPYARQSGLELHYVGAVHADKEPGHLANQTDVVEAEIEAEVLDGPTRVLGLDIAGQVCDLIADRWVELHRCGQSDRYLTFLRTA
jgi:hypothetical protein